MCEQIVEVALWSHSKLSKSWWGELEMGSPAIPSPDAVQSSK